MNSSFQAFTFTLRREIVLNFRKRNEYMYPIIFFILVSLLFPLASAADPHFLKRIAVSVIWVGATLASLLSLNHLFNDDFEDGSLDQLFLQCQPASLCILAKMISHWIMGSCPLLLIVPIFGIMFYLSGYVILILMLSVCIGTLILNLIGGILASLTVGLRQGAMLLALLLLPLYVPTLIFASQAVIAAQNGYTFVPQFMLLLAIALVVIVISPIVSASALLLAIRYER